MKLLYISDIDFSEEGAAKVHVSEVLENIARKGNTVRLILPKCKDKAQVSTQRFSVKHLPVAKGFALRGATYNLSLLFYLPIALLKSRPETIYVRQSSSLLAPALISFLLGKRLVIELNGPIKDEMKTYKNPEWAIGLSGVVEAISYKVARKIIVVTPGIKDYVLRNYGIDPQKVIVIENGVNTNMFQPIPARTARTLTGLDKEVYYLGYVGGLFNWQGLSDIIIAMGYIPQAIKVILVIIGSGPEGAELVKFVRKNKLGDRVIFIGSVERSKIPGYINSFDICYCYPNKIRAGVTSPFKMYEYLSCGRPVIFSDIDGLSQNFSSVAMPVQPDNAKSLALKTEELLKNAKKRQELSVAAREYILNGHSWESVAVKILNTIKA